MDETKTPRRSCRHLRYVGDPELVRLAQKGILEAYDELLARYRNPVLLALRQLAPPDVAQDLAQEAFLRAYRSLHQLRDPERFGAWVFIIARNVARRAGRPSEAASDPLPPEQPDTCDGNCPLRETLKRERRDTVRAALAELPPELRIPLSLFYTEGWAARQIADFLELPLTTVNWRLHTGRKRVRALIEHLEESHGG